MLLAIPPLVFILFIYFSGDGPVYSLGENLHRLCIAQVSNNRHQVLNSAFICGHELTSETLYELFRQTGVLHIIVVSGSHLIFLQSLLKPLCRKVIYGQWLHEFE